MIESDWFKNVFKDVVEGTKVDDEGQDVVVERTYIERALVGEGLKATSSRLLLAFMGAAHGSYFSVNSFVEETFESYR